MKIGLWIAIGLLMFVGACTGGIFTWVGVATVDVAEEADTFLDMLENRDLYEAYKATSSGFQAHQDLETFIDTVSEIHILRASLEPWRDRHLVQSNLSRMWGAVLDQAAQRVPFVLDMVKENGEWKVLSFTDETRTDVGPGVWFSLVPPKDVRNSLVEDTMSAFYHAVRDNDFTEFYDNMSVGAKTTIPIGNIQAAYQYFIDDEIDISGVETVTPMLDRQPVELGADGQVLRFLGPLEKTVTFSMDRTKKIVYEILIISGYYPIDPQPMSFKFRYRYEHPNWKLYQFLVEEPDVKTLTNEQCINWLLKKKDWNTDQCRAPSEAIKE